MHLGTPPTHGHQSSSRKVVADVQPHVNQRLRIVTSGGNAHGNNKQLYGKLMGGKVSSQHSKSTVGSFMKREFIVNYSSCGSTPKSNSTIWSSSPFGSHTISTPSTENGYVAGGISRTFIAAKSLVPKMLGPPTRVATILEYGNITWIIYSTDDIHEVRQAEFNDDFKSSQVVLRNSWLGDADLLPPHNTMRHVMAMRATYSGFTATVFLVPAIYVCVTRVVPLGTRTTLSFTLDQDFAVVLSDLRAAI
ncbi:hypothetical protein L1987_06577 [Smallanthus sonchifolius]|uniref:Uncharacterized protein n=1 Tax=Smallanthus sonchifolius TaxID=185202 RepID=A0ACB9JYQ6_9ASTR|nr:hypothetical protein L1987_06577 [Smallanthus sonchifolius]